MHNIGHIHNQFRMNPRNEWFAAYEPHAYYYFLGTSYRNTTLLVS